MSPVGLKTIIVEVDQLIWGVRGGGDIYNSKEVTG